MIHSPHSLLNKDLYLSIDGDFIDIDEFGIIDLIADDDTTFRPYYSSYDTIITKHSKIEFLSRAILNLERDFININDLLDALTIKYGLSLPLSKIKGEVLESIDLTGIGETDATNFLLI